MSRRRELQLKLGSLSEIGNIMVAMKNLAFMETRKLAQFLSAQQTALASIEAAAADFNYFYRQDSQPLVSEAYLLIGSERGFCGDFNERLLRAMDDLRVDAPILAIGRRLESRLRSNPSLVELIEGPTVAEEVAQVLSGVADSLGKMQRKLPAGQLLGITALYHETEGIKARRLLPIPESKPLPRPFSHPPELTLDPADFFSQFTEHYLYAALHEAFYSSMMVENHYRLEHMDHAISQLEQRSCRLKQRYNQLRQEEIIEEIEIIMLSVETLAGIGKS